MEFHPSGLSALLTWLFGLHQHAWGGSFAHGESTAIRPAEQHPDRLRPGLRGHSDHLLAGRRRAVQRAAQHDRRLDGPGRSRWQTLWRVVLPSASPGIFAAVMIGFGRAVGETMIVLMATGNTPIMDWSPLNGMRTLSANIAVEIPEARSPSGLPGTLYRVLVPLRGAVVRLDVHLEHGGRSGPPAAAKAIMASIDERT